MNTFRHDESRFVWAFAALFIIFGIGYAVFTPIFENSDETLHYPYVKHLADGNGLPLAIPGQLWRQEGTQPPLYYAVVAATTFWIDTGNLAGFLQYNPHWLFTEVRSRINDNQNRVLHGPMDNFPYRRAALAIHIGRWWSIFFGLITVICTFLIARHLFPNALPPAITATALTALTPQFIRVSATVSNDSLSAALASLAVLLALKFTEPHLSRAAEKRRRSGAGPAKSTDGGRRPAVRFSNKHAVMLGLVAGLALLTKLSSLTTFILIALIIFWRLFFLGEMHQRPRQNLVRWLLIAAAVTALLNGWWFLRNYRLYGEWLATETHLNLAGRGSLSPLQIWNLRPEIERAYWGTFGWGQIRLPEGVYLLLSWLSRLGLLGLPAALLTKLVQGNKQKPIPLNVRHIQFEPIIFLLIWAGLNLIIYIRWVMEVGSVSHTRLIFPAITAVSLLLALGWHALLPRRVEPWFSAVLTAGLLALNIYSLGWLIRPAFSPANERICEFVNSDWINSAPLDVTFIDKLQLAKGRVYPNVGASAKNSAAHGDVVIIEAQWQTLAPMDKNYSVAATLLAPDGSVLAQRETYPGLGLRPTRYLKPYTTFIDSYPLKLNSQFQEPFVAKAVVSLFDYDSEERAGFPALNSAGSKVTPVVGQIKIVPKIWPKYQPEHETTVNFGNAITLTGYDLTPSQNQPSSPNSLTLYWKSTAAVSQDFNLFIHLLDAKGNVVAQADAPPTRNRYPTGWWSPGETIAGQHILPHAPDATHLRLGLYSLATGRRLPITESILPQQDSSVTVELR